VSFLTPLGGARPPAPGALAWFPPVGLALGAGLGAVWWAADGLWPPAMAAAVVVGADLGLTGLLHVDGLVDAADGLLAHGLPRERRLEVMHAPEAGAFGVAAAGAVLLLRWSALASLRPSPPLLGALWCLSRTAMAAIALSLPYARPGGGLATAFLPPPAGGAGAGAGTPSLMPVVAGGLALAVPAAVLWRPVPGLAALAAAALAATGVALAARRRLGGFTGDVLGAAGMLAETAGLVVAAARW
jgi:adenosylcobinamide-GDP ribazoletransferase